MWFFRIRSRRSGSTSCCDILADLDRTSRDDLAAMAVHAGKGVLGIADPRARPSAVTITPLSPI